MKKSKKGFTLVELIIVIAVIAILAAVLIPTFSSVVDKANRSAAESEGTNFRTGIITELPATVGTPGTTAYNFDEFLSVIYGAATDDVAVTGAQFTTWFGADFSVTNYLNDATNIKVNKTGDVFALVYETGKFTVKITSTSVSAS